MTQRKTGECPHCGAARADQHSAREGGICDAAKRAARGEPGIVPKTKHKG